MLVCYAIQSLSSLNVFLSTLNINSLTSPTTCNLLSVKRVHFKCFFFIFNALNCAYIDIYRYFQHRRQFVGYLFELSSNDNGEAFDQTALHFLTPYSYFYSVCFISPEIKRKWGSLTLKEISYMLGFLNKNIFRDMKKLARTEYGVQKNPFGHRNSAGIV